MHLGIIAVLFFIVCAVVLTAVGLGFRYLEAERRRRLTKVLASDPSSDTVQQATTTILMNVPADETSITRRMTDLPLMKELDCKIRQAGLQWSALGVIAAMAVLGCAGLALGVRVKVPVYREFTMLALAGFLAFLPYGWVVTKRKKRLGEFEMQFPEALDFLARSMRAGHAFSVSLEMLSYETPDPLGIEFRQVFNEQNLGSPLEVAMHSLADRVPLLDVRFFVSAVLMQRETGGNLAEILTKLAFVIRERIQLKGRVKAVSAHGRITALILSAMPVLTVLALTVIAPTYLAGMAADEDGRYLIVGALGGQFAGYLWMRKIIDIRV